MDQSKLQSFIQKLPKAELHVHLEATVAPKTILELAKRHHMEDTLPGRNVEDIKAWFQFSNFDHFVQILVTIQDLMRTPEDFALIAYHMGEDMARQNILYREATLTPHTHIDYQNKGLKIQDILEGLEQGRQKAKADFGVEIRWVFDIYRNLSFMMNDDHSYNPEPAEKTLEYALAGLEKGVVGFGIGGNEIGAPAEPFGQIFSLAKQAGLLSVPHAGETMGPESIWASVLDLQADRMGHGARAIEDPELMDYLKEHLITLELNPTSNLRLHIFPDITAHPFKKFDDYGIPVTINSDDPTLFNTTLSEEYALVARTFKYSLADLVRIARNAFLAAGSEGEIKRDLLHQFDLSANELLEAV
jgi:aminodeoxyfutalosine deaminase